MTNVTPRRSKRLQDGDSEEPEVAWDFGSASPRSRLNLCRQYDKIYHSSNEQLREKLAMFFPETAGESTDESPVTTYEPRVQPVARDSPATNRRKRAQERQRRKEKAMLDLDAVVKEINQNDARVSASPMLDTTPKSRRAERRTSPVAGVGAAAVARDAATGGYGTPCQLFGGAFECDDVLKDITENVDDIFTVSADDMDQAAACVGSEAGAAAAAAAPPPSSAGGGLFASGAERRAAAASAAAAARLSGSGRSASCSQQGNDVPPFPDARPPGKAVAASCSASSAAAAASSVPPSSHAASSGQRQAAGGGASQASAYTRQRGVAPAAQSRSFESAHAPPRSRSTGSAGDAAAATTKPRSQAAAASSNAAATHQKVPAQRKPAANISNQQQQLQQQRRCTQEEIDRKRRLAKQKLLKQKFSAQHAASQGRAT